MGCHPVTVVATFIRRYSNAPRKGSSRGAGYSMRLSAQRRASIAPTPLFVRRITLVFRGLQRAVSRVDSILNPVS
jgi:hypothetical protein